MNRTRIPATGKAVVLALCLPLFSCTPKEAAQENPRVTLHDKIQRRPLQVKGADEVESYLLDTLLRDEYHLGIIKLYNLRSHAPWAHPIEDGLPWPVWEGADPVDPDYTWASREAIERYRDLKFGVRIHFGLYQMYSHKGDTTGTQAWWAWYVDKSTNEFTRTEEDCVAYLKDYLTSWQRFNPYRFNGDEWGQLFKETGFRFAVLTTKHHDGFSMFHTDTKIDVLEYVENNGRKELTTTVRHFSIEDTPFERDIVREYIEGLRNNGLAVGLYFSHPDWTDYDARYAAGNIYRDPGYTRESDPEGYERFAMRHRQQLVELFTNYGKIDILSFDHGLPHALWPELKETVKILRKLQPDAMFRNRGIGSYGDMYTPEGSIPVEYDPQSKPWCAIGVSDNQTEAGDIIQKLLWCVSLGGNFQWNCDPYADGAFPDRLIRKMDQVGEWMAVNGDGIYATRPRENGLVREGDNIFYTRSKDHQTIYAFTSAWPGNALELNTVNPTEGMKISMFGYESPLKWEPGSDGIVISIPEELQEDENRPCKMAWGFKIEL